MRTIERERYLIILLIVLSTILRLYALSSTTDFLGDQGRAGLVALANAQKGTIPFAGPPTLKNQLLGPFFYYMAIIFFRLGSFNPNVPALATAVGGIITVALLYCIIRNVFSPKISLAATLLWAISPALVSQDRVFWEPNFIALFSTLFLASTIKIVKNASVKYWLLLGITVGILMQLHYFNMFFILLSGILFLYCSVNSRYKKQIPIHVTVLWALIGITAMTAIFLPFLWYEAHHTWRDISSIGGLIFSSSSSGLSFKPFINMLDFTGRIFEYFFTITNATHPKISGVLFFLTIASVIYFAIKTKEIIRSRALFVFCLIWLILGAFLMGMYQDVVFNHYLNFLLTPSIVLIAYVIDSIDRRAPHIFFFILILGAIIVDVVHIPIVYIPHNDIARAQDLTETAQEITHGEPFAFTLINSRSFSDLQYRFFFTKNRVSTVSINAATYRLLLIICDDAACPKELPNKISVLCNTDHCVGDYGEIISSLWHKKTIFVRPLGTIYLYEL